MSDKQVKCALSKDNHKLHDPITIVPCGHFGCKKCQPTGYSILKCNFCGQLNKKSNKLESKISSIYNDSLWLTPELVENTVSQSDFKIITFNHNPSDICVLSNEKIILINRIKCCLEIYDKEFNLINIINSIDNKQIIPSKLATDCINRIYIADTINHCVIVTDFEFNKIIEIVDSNSLEMQTALEPWCLCCAEEYVFIGDYDNKTILKFNHEAEFLELYKCGYHVEQLKATK